MYKFYKIYIMYKINSQSEKKIKRQKNIFIDCIQFLLNLVFFLSKLLMPLMDRYVSQNASNAWKYSE